MSDSTTGVLGVEYSQPYRYIRLPALSGFRPGLLPTLLVLAMLPVLVWAVGVEDAVPVLTIAQLFGNLPIVHHVGGLVKVVDEETGFAYRDHKSAALMGAMQKALRLFRDRPEKIREMRSEAVRSIHANYTWDKVLDRYLSLYEEALLRVQ
jgi:glycosyltransferase involved in cell wall biosynthesis